MQALGHYGFLGEDSTLAELVAGAEATIADIERSIMRQVPETGWALPGEPRLQSNGTVAPGDASVVGSSFPWLGLGVVAAIAAGSYYYFRKKKST